MRTQWSFLIPALFICLGLICLRQFYDRQKRILDRKPPSGVQLYLDSQSQSQSPHSEALGSTPGALRIPVLLSPLTGAVYETEENRSIEIVMRWTPLTGDLKPEIELHQEEDPDLDVPISLKKSGALVFLKPGSYSWRVRALNAQLQKSEWSPRFFFKIRSLSVKE